jgi:glycine cleavage system H lipoate-binding protein
MRCPFLREAQVKTCVASEFRKLIVRLPDQRSMERCSSPGYEQCPAAKQYRLEVADRSHCPFLQESLMQYCSAAPVVKYIPYTESPDCRCATGRYSRCALYAAMAGAWNGESRDADAREHPGSPPECAPENLWYARNHMWLDLDGDRMCHVGVDSFLAGLLRSVDSIEYTTRRGHCAPSVVIVSDGTRLPLSFPGKLMITGVNPSLRVHPSRLLDDPYRTGWLFEGLDMEEHLPGSASALTGELIPGTSAPEWMRGETGRMNDFIHGLVRVRDGYATMADGGEYQRRLIHLLDAGQRKELVERFFTNRGGGRNGR